MKLVKFCLVSPLCYKLFHPLDERILPFSGSEIQLYQLGYELVKDERFEVHYFTGFFYPTQKNLEIFSNINKNQKRSIYLHKVFKYFDRIPLVSTISDFMRLYREMKKNNADSYLIWGCGTMAGKVAFLSKFFFGKAFFLASVHDRESNMDYIKNNNFFKNLLFKYAIKKADLLICQHEEQKKMFKKNFGVESRIIQTMYPVKEIDYDYCDIDRRDYVLWVSRLEKWKRPELFIELARKYPELKFVLISNSDTSKIKEEYGFIKNLSIVEKVSFFEMDKYFLKAKVFINTSISEGFPNTFVQASNNGTPILSLNVDPDQILEKYNIGYCAKDSLKQFNYYFEKIIRDKDLWKKMSLNCYGYVKDKHDIKKIVEEYKQIILSHYS